jgi:hypothetical protein
MIDMSISVHGPVVSAIFLESEEDTALDVWGVCKLVEHCKALEIVGQ